MPYPRLRLRRTEGEVEERQRSADRRIQTTSTASSDRPIHHNEVDELGIPMLSSVSQSRTTRAVDRGRAGSEA